MRTHSVNNTTGGKITKFLVIYYIGVILNFYSYCRDNFDSDAISIPTETISLEPFPQSDSNAARGRRQPTKSSQPSSTPGVGGGGSRKRKVNKHSSSNTYKDLGRWKPVDDLLLVQAVLQVN